MINAIYNFLIIGILTGTEKIVIWIELFLLFILLIVLNYFVNKRDNADAKESNENRGEERNRVDHTNDDKPGKDDCRNE